MFRLPEDIEKQLQNKYPNVHIKHLIQNLFQMLLDKTLQDGCCTIREFGKFEAYTTPSKRIGTDVLRFKFRISGSLDNKIKLDPFLIENAVSKAKNTFDKSHEDACADCQDQKEENQKAARKTTKKGLENTQKNLAFDAIAEALREDDNG